MHSIVFLSALAHAFSLTQNSDLGALITSATLKPDLRLPHFVNGAAKKYNNTWNVNRNLYLIADNSAQIESQAAGQIFQAADQTFNWGQDVQCSECKFLRKGVVPPKENQQLRTACVIKRGTPPNQWLDQWQKFGFPPKVFYNDFLQVLLQSKNGVKDLSLADQESESTDIVAYWTLEKGATKPDLLLVKTKAANGKDLYQLFSTFNDFSQFGGRLADKVKAQVKGVTFNVQAQLSSLLDKVAFVDIRQEETLCAHMRSGEWANPDAWSHKPLTAAMMMASWSLKPLTAAMIK